MKKIKEIKNHTISARFPKSLVKKLKEIAKEERRTMSVVIQMMIEKDIQSRND